MKRVVVDTRLRCGVCNEFMPKNVDNHSCRAFNVTCKHCKRAPRKASEFCVIHNECMNPSCRIVMYKRIGYCEQHSCRWDVRLATLADSRKLQCTGRKVNGVFCFYHLRWLKDNAKRFNLCRNCGAPRWYLFVPYWLVKERLISKNVAQYMLKFIVCCSR